MLRSQRRASFLRQTWAKRVETLSLSVLLTTGLVTLGMPNLLKNSAIASEVDSIQALPDGTYLYGQAPEPEKLGAEYLVFEVNQGEVIGGFYMPRSSFDCFHGKVESGQLALTVVNSYEQTSHAYSVALQPNDSVASAGSGTVPVGLEGYHQLNDLSETDQQILATCRSDYNGR